MKKKKWKNKKEENNEEIYNKIEKEEITRVN